MPAVTTVASTSSPLTMSLLTPTVTNQGNALHSVNHSRYPPWTWHQLVASQGAMFKTNRPVARSGGCATG